MLSIYDYIPTLPEGSFDDNESIELDLEQAAINMIEDASIIIEETNYISQTLQKCDYFEKIPEYAEEIYGITQEAFDTSIGVDLGLGNGKRDKITKDRNLIRVNVNPKISLFETFTKKLKELALRVITAIKNFFISIFQFFQSKIFKIDKLLIHSNFQKIVEYHNSTDQVQIKTARYLIYNPIEEFKKDQGVLKTAIPKLKNAIIKMIQDIEFPSQGETVSYKTFKNNTAEVDETFQEILHSISYKNANMDIVNEFNIARIIRHKYFGEKKETATFEVRELISDTTVYEYIISDEMFKSFQNLYKSCSNDIHDTIKTLDRFTKNLKNMYTDSYFYQNLQNIVNRYRGLLTTMLYVCVAYWELYFTIRNSVIAAARAIINRDK